MLAAAESWWLTAVATFWVLQTVELFEGISLKKHIWSYLGASVLLLMDDECMYVYHNTAYFMLTSAVTKAEEPVATVTPPDELQL